MDSREQVKEVIRTKGGIAKAADFVAVGIKAVAVVNLCNAGFLKRVRHGYYKLSENSTVSEEQLPAPLFRRELFVLNPLFFITDTVTLRRVNGQLPYLAQCREQN